MAATPIFAGSSTGLVALPGAVMTKNAFGIDVLSRPFYAPRASVLSHVPSAGTSDIVYGNLHATGNYSITEEEGLTCKIAVEYKGLLNGSIPDALYSTGLSSGSASGTSINSSPDAVRTMNAVFLSPTETKRYLARSRPAVPDASGVSLPDCINILTIITDGNGRNATGTTGLTVIHMAQIASFSANPVPGTPYYECEATWKATVTIIPT